MKQNKLNVIEDSPIATLSRREFLKNTMMLSGAVMLGGLFVPRTGHTAAFTLPTHGSTYIDVKTKGAKGDGINDDTAEIQSAINALPSAGGTVFVPAGRYMINAVTGLRLKSNMLFKMDPKAELYIKTNSADRYYALYMMNVSNIEISGGKITGDRDRHTGTTGEWGYGIMCGGRNAEWTESGPGSRVYIHDIIINKCWGDGICVGAGSKDIEIRRVVCDQARRQGLSITKSTNVRVFDSTFSNTNGTSPECGIDVEPDLPAFTSGVLVQNCILRGNAKYGINIFTQAQTVTVTGCTIEENGSCGVVTVNCSGVNITSNNIRNNSATGIRIQSGTANLNVSSNTFFNNYNRLGDRDRADFTQKGYSSKVDRDLLIQSGVSNVVIGTNYYK
jgi:polygalacturonase